MKNWIKCLGLSSALLLLVACNQETSTQEASSSEAVASEESVELVDQAVNFDEGTQLLTMDETEKKERYSELDMIDIFTGETETADTYSQINNIETEKDYAELLVSTNEKPAIVYLGFNECPFCKVFTPKINQLASEMGIEIYYYNTKEHAEDATFASAMQLYNVETVPHAFIVENAKAGSKVNHESTMLEIEAFLQEYLEIQ